MKTTTLTISILLHGVLLMGCTSAEDTGALTIVGNPGMSAARMAPTDASATIAQASGELAEVSLYDCDGRKVDGDVSASLDLLQGEGFELIPGHYCEAIFVFDAITFDGTVETGDSYEVALDQTRIAASSTDGLVIDGQGFVLELAFPGWLTAERLDIEPGVDKVIGPEDTEALAIEALLQSRSALYEDTDDDNEVSTEERDRGEVLEGEERE